MKNYKIKHTTEKALKIEIEGLTFWIPKAWVSENGTLSAPALKAYEEASRKKASPKKGIDIEVLIEDAISIGHESVNLTSLKLIWLKEITLLLSLLFEHERMINPDNKIYAIDVHERIAKKLKTN